MTKKDYELIAFVLRNDKLIDETGVAERQFRFYAEGFADRFAGYNPKFDRDKFLTACGIEFQEDQTLKNWPSFNPKD